MKIFYMFLALLSFNFSYSVITPDEIEHNVGTGKNQYEQIQILGYSQFEKIYKNWQLPFYFRVEIDHHDLWFKVVEVEKSIIRFDLQTKQWEGSRGDWLSTEYMAHFDYIYPSSELYLFPLILPPKIVKGSTYYTSIETTISFHKVNFFVKKNHTMSQHKYGVQYRTTVGGRPKTRLDTSEDEDDATEETHF